MADKPAAERSEKATPERLRKARREGRVAQSTEVPSGLMVALLLIVLALTGPALGRRFASAIRAGLSYTLPESLDAGVLPLRLSQMAASSLLALLPFLLAGLAVSVFGGLLVGGWAFAAKLLSPDLGRMSPVKGLKNLFSLQATVRLLTSMAKLVLILVIVYFSLRGRLALCLSLKWASAGQSLLVMAKLVFGLMTRIAIALLAVGIVDAFFQRWKHRRDLRMTRQEVKEEMKEHELSPLVRTRIRSLQLSMARKRMLKQVPLADVVVTNPTHLAVALKYDAHTMQAPQVVAKGADFLAEKIRQIAADHGVPIVQRPALARTLYDTVELGQVIPETLFVAVAEVLAMIYRLRNKRRNLTGSDQTE
ncbi:MAG: hypothetical protein AMJ81_00425 [Phycisphaerae bacterium SM23_33]|nr:MAG: hypothetical protein AMJ81_00425 [Phycisphaerae bacterium SM23_33]